jgi:hypothetical protein
VLFRSSRILPRRTPRRATIPVSTVMKKIHNKAKSVVHPKFLLQRRTNPPSEPAGGFFYSPAKQVAPSLSM